MLAFAHFLDDLFRERFEIAGIARGDDALIGHDFAVFPFGAGIDHVGLDRIIRRHLAALGDAGLDQEPRRMAHGGDRLAGIEKRLDERQRVLVDAQQIRIDLPAGQHDSVVIVGLRARERLVDLHRAAPVLLVPAFDLAAFRRDDIDLRARGFQPIARNFEFRLLETVGGENEDFLAVEFSGHGGLLSSVWIGDNGERRRWLRECALPLACALKTSCRARWTKNAFSGPRGTSWRTGRRTRGGIRIMRSGLRSGW